MPRILILGATGYLGNNLANILVREGQHTVYGIARSHEKATQLARQEILPIQCDDPVNSPDMLVDQINVHRIDTIVDVAGANEGSFEFLRCAVTAGESRLAAYTNNGMKGSKLGFIYCSGTWVHGSSDKLVNDLDIPAHGTDSLPPELVAWRVPLEKAILESRNILDVMILRPALIYGRESTIWSTLIGPLHEAARSNEIGPVSIPLESDSRPGLIHVDDAAKAFECAINKLHLVSNTGVHPVFNLVTSQESMREIFEAMARCLQFKGYVQLGGPGDNAFFKAMGTTFRGSSARAQQVLGWRPTKTRGFVTDMDLYLSAFTAAQSL